MILVGFSFLYFRRRLVNAFFSVFRLKNKKSKKLDNSRKFASI